MRDIRQHQSALGAYVVQLARCGGAEGASHEASGVCHQAVLGRPELSITVDSCGSVEELREIGELALGWQKVDGADLAGAREQGTVTAAHQDLAWYHGSC